MKCDELKAYKADVTIPVYGTIADAKVYLKDKADAALSEKDKEIARQNIEIKEAVQTMKSLEAEIIELKAKLNESEEARYEAGADAADYYQDNRRLKRALWLARAERAESEARGWYHSTGYCVKYDGGHTIKGALFGKGLLRLPNEWMKIWLNVERKCREKAKEYK